MGIFLYLTFMKLSKILFEEAEIMTLNQLYDGDTPDESEMIWNFVGLDDFDIPFRVIDIDPVKIWNEWKPDGSQTMQEVYELYADRNQKRHIAALRKELKRGKVFDPVVVSGDELVDGNHRVAAMALEGIRSAKALNLEQEEQENEVI